MGHSCVFFPVSRLRIHGEVFFQVSPGTMVSAEREATKASGDEGVKKREALER